MIFLVLIALSTALFTVGLYLWIDSSNNLKKADESFITIGTVQQKENTMEMEAVWDAYLKDYIYYNIPVYDSYISDKVLQTDSIEYIVKPMQRPFYGAYLHNYKVKDTTGLDNEGIPLLTVAEFKPVRDCVPSGPVEVDIVRVLYGHDISGQRILFCDHNTEHTYPMTKGQSYIAAIYFFSSHDGTMSNISTYEYVPSYNPLFSGDSPKFEEVTDDFYNSERGGSMVFIY
jgi:hypothetical protein